MTFNFPEQNRIIGALAQKSEFSLRPRQVLGYAQGGYGLQPRVAGPAAWVTKEICIQSLMRLWLLGAFSRRKRRNRVAVEYLRTSFPG